MRVLLITNDYPPRPGGIQQYLSNLVRYSSACIRVLAPAHPGAPAEPHVARSGWKFMWPTSRVREWIAGQMVEFEPDVLLFGAPHPLAQLGPRLSRTFGLPYVVMAHGAEVTLPGAVPGVRQLLGRTFRRASLVLTVSRYTARRVERMGAVRTTVLGAGVDLDTFTPGASTCGRDRPVIGCISRLVPRKGHLRVLAAAERLSAAGTPVSVLLAGRGRLEGRVRNRAARAAIPVEVVTDAAWEELPDLYRSCDVFVMPARSRWLGLEIEGLGIVYLEASATGVPVVAGTSGGAPETVVPGVTGYLAVTTGQIAEAVGLALEQRPEMGAAARAHAERHFSWESVAGRLDSALRQAVDGI
ncbi:MAG: glycosyltransferase family 4 protein [bacterium]|nr:glycosyltransferase family 4 protein [bacterium]MDE0353591.1 glycosyltransferase family 4 protein [bacterium]